MLEYRRDGSVREIPPEQCPTCAGPIILVGWGECPLKTCGQMGRTYYCADRHTTMADWHQHRTVPSDRPRWHCRYEPEPPSSSSKNPD